MLYSLQSGVIVLLKSALENKTYSLPDDLDLQEVFNLAKKHQILNMIYTGAVKCGIPADDSVLQQFFFPVCRIISYSENQMLAISKIFEAFDSNDIDYMPLKGSVLKKMYPKPEMRSMGDADILIRTNQYPKIKPVMVALGFTEINESDHELIWEKKGILHLELHKRLIPSYNKDYYSYFGDGWDKAYPVPENKNCYTFSDEDQFIYLFSHFAKHYRDAGIGIKHLLDLWIYTDRNPGMDYGYITEELKKLQLYEFFCNILDVLKVWFGGAPATDKTDFITDVIFNSGSYGTHSAYVLSAAVKASRTDAAAPKSAFQKFIIMFFPPYSAMCERYDFLKTAPVLLPIMWIFRWFTALLFRRENIKKQNDDLKIMSGKKIQNYQQSLNYVGLDFNFKE